MAYLQDRGWNNYSGRGFGLRGGTWTCTGGRILRFRLDGVRLLPRQAVTGRATWDRDAERMQVDLTLRGAGPNGHLRGHWDTRSLHADAVLRGVLAGRRVRLTFEAA